MMFCNSLKQKKGMSNIMVTILVVLISIVIVSLVSLFVLGLLGNFTISVNKGTFSVDSVCYETSTNSLSVYISRNLENVSGYNFTGLEISYYSETESSKWRNSFVPGMGEGRGYIISSVEVVPYRVEVSPIITLNGKERKGSVTSVFGNIEVAESCLKSEIGNDAFVGADKSLGLTPPSPPLGIPEL